MEGYFSFLKGLTWAQKLKHFVFTSLASITSGAMSSRRGNVCVCVCVCACVRVRVQVCVGELETERKIIQRYMWQKPSQTFYLTLRISSSTAHHYSKHNQIQASTNAWLTLCVEKMDLDLVISSLTNVRSVQKGLRRLQLVASSPESISLSPDDNREILSRLSAAVAFILLRLSPFTSSSRCSNFFYLEENLEPWSSLLSSLSPSSSSLLSSSS